MQVAWRFAKKVWPRRPLTGGIEAGTRSVAKTESRWEILRFTLSQLDRSSAGSNTVIWRNDHGIEDTESEQAIGGCAPKHRRSGGWDARRCGNCIAGVGPHRSSAQHMLRNSFLYRARDLAGNCRSQLRHQLVQGLIVMSLIDGNVNARRRPGRAIRAGSGGQCSRGEGPAACPQGRVFQLRLDLARRFWLRDKVNDI